MSALSAWLRRCADRMNPIAVKELRQISRGKFLTVILLGFLMTQLTVTGLFSAFGSPNLGPTLFHALLAFLTATCALLIPAYAGFRLANERAGANLDLLFTSALKPAAIIWGKTLSAGLLAAMIYSVSMPFIVMTFILRGIDLPLAFLLLAISFVYVMLAAQIGIMIGCMPANRILKGVIGLFAMGVVFAFQMSGTWFLAGWGFARDDPLTMIAAAGMRAPMVILAVWALIAAMCFILSTAFISPPSANRAFVPRLYLTAVWAVSLLAVSVWIRVSHSEEPLFYWFVFACAVFSWAMPFSVSERDQIGPRVRQQIPRSGWRRLLAFLFYSGSAGGALWAVIILVFTFLSAWINAAALPHIVNASEFLDMCAALGFTCLSLWVAAAGAVLIHRKFLKKRVPNGSTWLIAVGVYIASNTAFVFMLIGTGASFNAPIWAMALFGAFVGMDDPPIWIAAIAAFLAGVACLPWIGRQTNAFKPPAPEPPLAAERELS